MAFIEQDLTTKGGLIGRLQAHRKRAGSQEWEQIWGHPIKNKIVNAGITRMAYGLMAASEIDLKYGAIGIGTTAATDTDTMCESQILTRSVAVRSTVTTAILGDTAKWVSSFTSDTTSYAVTEYGTFSTASSGTMLNHVVFGAITLNLNDVLEFSYTVQVTEA